MIINITSSPDIGLDDVEQAAGMITQSAHPDANIIWGTAFDESLSDEMQITVVATGFDNTPDSARQAAATPKPVLDAQSAEAPAPAAQAESSAAAPAAPAAPAASAGSEDDYGIEQIIEMLNKRR